MSLPSETAYWAWSIKGLGGAVALCESLAQEGPRITQHYHEDIVRLAARLTRLSVALYERRIDEGAAFAKIEFSDVERRQLE